MGLEICTGGFGTGILIIFFRGSDLVGVIESTAEKITPGNVIQIKVM